MPQSDFWPFIKTKGEEQNVDSCGESSVLQKQLGDMEGEVKEIQMEIAAIKKDRMELFNRVTSKDVGLEKDDNIKTGDSINFSDEKFNRISEIAKLREELIRAKNTADEERFQREKYEEKLNDLEKKLDGIYFNGMHDVKRNTAEDNIHVKNQIRDLKEEAEEMKITLNEKCEQLQEYRVKYLQAEEQVEELRRQLEVMEYDNKQVSDQIHIEIQKMKMQFQEKLQELSPLPDLLKGAQIQLQEAKQLQRLAEDNTQELSNELHRVKEKLVIAVNSFNQEQAERRNFQEEIKQLRLSLEEKHKEVIEYSKSLEEHKSKNMRLEERLAQQETRFREKIAELNKLHQDLDELREESSRSLIRCKERADTMRRHLTTQISELERQLVQSRAQCRSCQRERDEIRQRMQLQINNLQENFQLVEIRLRSLQNQVSSLKSSYTVILADDDDEVNSEFSKIIQN